MIKQIRNSKFVIRNFQSGMTYVELIVVLSIFSIMTSIILFNYGGFQDKVDIKILANDIALKIVEAQKSSMSGKWNINASGSWKPSYGVYFDPSNDKIFVYFADFNNNSFYDGSSCAGECLEEVSITKGNKIFQIDKYSGTTPTQITNSLSVIFKRPDSSAVFSSNGSLLNNFDYIQITISSSGTDVVKSYIKIYPSGRIQIN